MGKKRPISPIEVEPSPRQLFSSLQGLTTLVTDTVGLEDLLGEGYLDLHSAACFAESQGKVIKATKSMLTYLIQAALRIPALVKHWKRLTSQTLTILEATTARLIREEKVKTAAKLLRAIDTAIDTGLKTDQGKWHRVRVLHL
jgi:hypothetical protein